MPLELELCAVPHLKGLINAENIPSRQERGSSFTQETIHLESPILPHTEPRPYFNIAGSVVLKTLQKIQEPSSPCM